MATCLLVVVIDHDVDPEHRVRPRALGVHFGVSDHADAVTFFQNLEHLCSRLDLSERESLYHDAIFAFSDV